MILQVSMGPDQWNGRVNEPVWPTQLFRGHDAILGWGWQKKEQFPHFQNNVDYERRVPQKCFKHSGLGMKENLPRKACPQNLGNSTVSIVLL